MSAWISNCGPRYRLEYMSQLMHYGVPIHSYGMCNRNRELPSRSNPGEKERLIRTYKFTFAFENSETDDYITEKMWGVLSSGSVPGFLKFAKISFLKFVFFFFD